MALAFTRWRQLSAFLLNPLRSERRPLTPDHFVGADQQARALARSLNTAFLGYFAGGGPRGDDATAASQQQQTQQQEAHLRDVIAECAKFAYLLFSQPADFRLTFDDGGANAIGRRRPAAAGVGGGRLVVCPGLEKLSDAQGNRLDPLQILVPPTVEFV